jgi:hypothetical protein
MQILKNNIRNIFNSRNVVASLSNSVTVGYSDDIQNGFIYDSTNDRFVF